MAVLALELILRGTPADVDPWFWIVLGACFPTFALCCFGYAYLASRFGVKIVGMLFLLLVGSASIEAVCYMLSLR